MFSEKYGYKEPKEILYEDVSDSLRNRIWNLFYQKEILEGENDALDLVQDAIYKGLKSIDSIGEIENFKGWFYRILLRCSIDFIRDNKKYVYVDDDVYFNNISSNDIYKDFDLEDALDKLPEKYKTVVILRYFEDMKIEEIAEVLDENINTIKTRLYSAIKKLNIQMQF